MANTVLIQNLSTKNMGAVFFSVIDPAATKTITDFPTVDIDNYLADYDKLSTLGGYVEVDGTARAGSVSVVAAGTLADATRIAKLDSTGGIMTIVLMSTADVPVGAKVYLDFIVDGGDVTIDGDGSETIDGNATLVLSAVGLTVIESDGANWVFP